MQRTVQQIADELAAELRQKLGVGGKDLASVYRRARHRLPRLLRRDVQTIVDVLPVAANPKLLRMVDVPRLEAAAQRVMAHLKTVNPNVRRIDLALSIVGGVAISLIAAGALLVTVLAWKGLL